MNLRSRKNKPPTGRVEGGFLALPWDVLDSVAYAGLSGAAIRLLLEIGRQFVRDNNGRLLSSMKYLRKRGWTSAGTVTNALRELEAAGFIHQTVKGHRPNKANWWAVTWQNLDRIQGYDPGAAETFRKGAYRKAENAALIPKIGATSTPIAPKTGAGKVKPMPKTGAMQGSSGHLSIPKSGNHLDKPSTAGAAGQRLMPESPPWAITPLC
jgi:hypothetical protein